jgi:hypothetical protein
MTTIGKLIELLSDYPKDFPVTNEQNESFIHIVNGKDNVILSTKKPIAYCNRSGGYVYPTTTPGYFGFSPELDEDVYEIETLPLN